ncbi:MAG: TerC family protein [Bryobacteraceae bacterium]
MPISHLILRILTIVWIDLLLAGDNALVIALAVRSLPTRQRRTGSAFGAAAAVALRVGLTFVAAQILNVQYLKLAGGLFVLWIAVKVLVDASEPPDAEIKPRQLLQAVWYIVFADLTMSTDNVLAVAGASGGSFELILFGLALSIPFVIFSANLLAELMNRYPILIYLGAGILGRVAGEMILTDRFTDHLLHPSDLARYIVEGVLVVAVMAAGKLLSRKRPA